MERILIVEDDLELAELITLHLQNNSCHVVVASRGDSGFQLASTQHFDLIILDLLLPGMDGIEICKRLRAQGKSVPVLILSGRSEELDKVLGFQIGADDYVTKPFGLREFVARVKAILRRTSLYPSVKEGEIIWIGELMIDPVKRKIIKNADRIDLTRKEYELFHLLMSNPGRVYSREDLLNIIWGNEFNGYKHTIDSHINRLRAKIETNTLQPQYILTVWGIGYKFCDELDLRA